MFFRLSTLSSLNDWWCCYSFGSESLLHCDLAKKNLKLSQEFEAVDVPVVVDSECLSDGE